MRSVGIVRKIDQLGRIVIPIEIKRRMDIKAKDLIEFLIDKDRIVVQKYYPACTFCGEKEKDESERFEFSGKIICKSCFQGVADLNN